MYYTLYALHYTLYSIHYALYIIHYALYVIHYTPLLLLWSSKATASSSETESQSSPMWPGHGQARPRAEQATWLLFCLFVCCSLLGVIVCIDCVVVCLLCLIYVCSEQATWCGMPMSWLRPWRHVCSVYAMVPVSLDKTVNGVVCKTRGWQLFLWVEMCQRSQDNTFYRCRYRLWIYNCICRWDSFSFSHAHRDAYHYVHNCHDDLVQHPACLAHENPRRTLRGPQEDPRRTLRGPQEEGPQEDPKRTPRHPARGPPSCPRGRRGARPGCPAAPGPGSSSGLVWSGLVRSGLGDPLTRALDTGAATHAGRRIAAASCPRCKVRALLSVGLVRIQHSGSLVQHLRHGSIFQGELRGSQGRGFEHRSTWGSEHVKNCE